MNNLLTYAEFIKIVSFTDKNASEKYLIYYDATEETYLYDMIGTDLITKLKAGDYTDVLPLVKKCIAYNIYLKFIKEGNITVTGEGAQQRTATYTDKAVFVDQQNKIKSVTEVLRSYEQQLLGIVQDLDEYNSNKNISKIVTFNLTSIG
jgi:hypothetical protein